jgi:hypothetical protein
VLTATGLGTLVEKGKQVIEGPGVSTEDILKRTSAKLIIDNDPPEMALS